MRRHYFIVVLCGILALPLEVLAGSSDGNADGNNSAGGGRGSGGSNSASEGSSGRGHSNADGNSNAGGSGNAGGRGANSGGASRGGGNGPAEGQGSAGGNSNVGGNALAGRSADDNSAIGRGSVGESRGNSNQGRDSNAIGYSNEGGTTEGIVSREPGLSRSRNEEAPRPNEWGKTSAKTAREAVAEGVALPLSAILATVSRTTPGQVLEVDLRQMPTGAWQYELLVLSTDRRYQVVVVDAKLNRVLQVRSR